MRKIYQTLTFMGFIAPWGAHALGIGDITLHSALNESLNAEIQLVTSSDTVDLSELRVTLASAAEFSRAHIERNFLLTKLHFATEQRPDGKLVIYVSSKEPIREPILDFMIEVYWPKGRLLREFTLLLDPPENTQSASLPDEELTETEEFKHPTQSPPPSETSRIQAHRNRGRTVYKAATDENPNPDKTPITGTSYGPIEKNETLWNIAQKFQSPEISQRQMLNALYKANPNAFYKARIDALKQGVSITIPDLDSLTRLTGLSNVRLEPRNTVKLEPKGKLGHAERLADKAPVIQGQLKLSPPPGGTIQADAPATQKPGSLGKTKEDLASEPSDTAKLENENFRKRLTDLERQLSAMQRLLVLKDEQISTLQARQPPPAKEGQQAAPPSNTPPAAPPVKIAPTALPQGEQANIQSAAQIPESAQAKTAPSQLPPTLSTSKAPPPDQPKPATPTQAQTPTKPVNPKTPTDEQEPKAGVLNQVYYLVAAAIAVLLLALLWQFQRRRTAIIEDAESILTLSESSTRQQQPDAEPETISHTLPEHATVFRSSFLSEFSPSDFDALSGEMTEVDPISEADVYLAYGRYKQAEDLIVDAIGQNPERDDCRLKLFEIHYATENAVAFENYAQELAPTHKETKPDFWEKVVEMGRELCPSSPLFVDNQQSDTSNAKLETASPNQSDVEDDIYLFNDESESSKPTSFLTPIENIPNLEEKPVEDAEPIVAYDFLSTESEAHGSENLSQKAENIDSKPPVVEQNISFGNAIAYPTEEDIEIEEVNMESVRAKLDALSEFESLPGSSEISLSSAVDHDDSFKQIEAIDLEDTDSLEFEIDPKSSVISEDTEFVRTKLDLAKAYYDLGDEETAKAILQEVVQLGNTQQKEDANTLLKAIDNKLV